MDSKFSYAVSYLSISHPLNHTSLKKYFFEEGEYNTKANFKRRDNYGFNQLSRGPNNETP
jgi:hypothetical protein